MTDKSKEPEWFQFHMSYSNPMVHNGKGGFDSYVVLPYNCWEEYPPFGGLQESSDDLHS